MLTIKKFRANMKYALYVILTIVMGVIAYNDQSKARDVVEGEPHFYREDGTPCWNFDWRWQRNLHCGPEKLIY